MLILSVETSSLTGGAAITSSGRVLGETLLSSRKTYSRRLAGGILWLMNELHISWEDLDLIAAGLGPGSFTGLRIGLAAAKGFALANSVPVFGVPTLDIIAQNALVEDFRLICPVMDARRKQVYTSLYKPGFPNSPERILDYLATEPSSLKDLIPMDSDVLFLGDGLAPYGELLRTLFGDRAVFAPEHLWYPSPSLTGLMAEKRLLSGYQVSDPGLLVPLYCRLSEAEENKRRRG